MSGDLSRGRLAAAIASARQNAGVSQELLGAQTGLGQTVISRIESGHRKVEVSELIAIADRLGVDLPTLLDKATSPTVDFSDQDLASADPELIALRLGEQGADLKSLEPALDFIRRMVYLDQLLGLGD